MRVVPAPQIEENNILHFSVETDMEINHPMFIKKSQYQTYQDIKEYFNFRNVENEVNGYIISVKEDKELDAYKLIAKYFLDWLNELNTRDLTEYQISDILTVSRTVEKIDLEIEGEISVEYLLEKVFSYTEELKRVIECADRNDLYYQKWYFEEEFQVTTYNFNVNPNQFAKEIDEYHFNY